MRKVPWATAAPGRLEVATYLACIPSLADQAYLHEWSRNADPGSTPAAKAAAVSGGSPLDFESVDHRTCAGRG